MCGAVSPDGFVSVHAFEEDAPLMTHRCASCFSRRPDDQVCGSLECNCRHKCMHKGTNTVCLAPVFSRWRSGQGQVYGRTAWHNSSDQQLGAAACNNVFRAYAQDAKRDDLSPWERMALHTYFARTLHTRVQGNPETKQRMNTSKARISESRVKACTPTSTHRALQISVFCSARRRIECFGRA